MSYGGDAADQIVRYTLEGTEVTLKLSGAAAKNFAVFAAAVLKDQQKTRGKTNLTRLLTAGKPLKFFLIPEDRAREFAKEAKARGLLFVPVKNKKQPGKIELAVWADDAAKVNRVLENMCIDYLQADTGDKANVEVETQLEQAPGLAVGPAKTELVQMGEGEVPIEIGETEDLFSVGFTQAPEPPLAVPAQNDPSAPSSAPLNYSSHAQIEAEQQGAGKSRESVEHGPTADELRKQGKKPSVKKELGEIKNDLKKRTSERKSRQPQRQHSARMRKKSKQQKGR